MFLEYSEAAQEPIYHLDWIQRNPSCVSTILEQIIHSCSGLFEAVKQQRVQTQILSLEFADSSQPWIQLELELVSNFVRIF